MQDTVDVLTALAMTVVTAAFAQFGVTVRCHAPAQHPAARQEVVRVPMRSVRVEPVAVGRRDA